MCASWPTPPPAQIDNLEQRIGRRLQPQHPRVRLDRSDDVGQIGRITNVKSSPKSRKIRSKTGSSAVDIIRGDDMIALFRSDIDVVIAAMPEANPVRTSRLERGQALLQRLASRLCVREYSYPLCCRSRVGRTCGLEIGTTIGRSSLPAPGPHGWRRFQIASGSRFLLSVLDSDSYSLNVLAK